MATSASVDYSMDRDDIITEALEQLGVLGEGQSPNADQLTSSARTLNMMVKSWQNRVKNLHVLQDLYVFQDGSSQQYTIDGTTHVTASMASTAVATAQTSGNNTLVVDSITGFSNGDNIGVELDDGTRQWTTINGAPSGSTITLTANLTDDVAVDNTVFGYTTKAEKPVRIIEGYVSDLAVPATPVDIPLDIMNRSDYSNLSNKTSTGTPNQVWPDYQRTSTILSVWPVADSVEKVLVLQSWRTIHDFDAASDDADFPQQWYLALSLNLAVLLAPKYGYPTRSGEMNNLRSSAQEAMLDAEAEELEESIRFVPDFRWRQSYG